MAGIIRLGLKDGGIRTGRRGRIRVRVRAGTTGAFGSFSKARAFSTALNIARIVEFCTSPSGNPSSFFSTLGIDDNDDDDDEGGF